MIGRRAPDLASSPLTRTREERKVAMVVVLFPVSDDEPSLQPAALDELARLGVTSIALLRDSSLAGLVLEGWAFDPRDAHRGGLRRRRRAQGPADAPAGRAHGGFACRLLSQRTERSESDACEIDLRRSRRPPSCLGRARRWQAT